MRQKANSEILNNDIYNRFVKQTNINTNQKYILELEI
jgi:hypothetical protein